MFDAKEFEVLSHEKQKELVKKYQAGDQAAGDKLVTCNIRFVRTFIAKFNEEGREQDLMQAGIEGLCKARDRYDPSREASFLRYASFYIKSCVIQAISNFRTIKRERSRETRKVSINIGKSKRKLISEGKEVTPKNLAKEIGVDEQDVIDFLKAGDIKSLDAPVSKGSDKTLIQSFSAKGPAPDEECASNEILELFRDFGKTLTDDREKYIFFHRVVSPCPETLNEIGDEFGVSGERIRQVENRITKKLKEKAVKRGIAPGEVT